MILNYNQFDLQVVVVGPEYFDGVKLLEALENAKTEWPGELY